MGYWNSQHTVSLISARLIAQAQPKTNHKASDLCRFQQSQVNLQVTTGRLTSADTPQYNLPLKATPQADTSRQTRFIHCIHKHLRAERRQDVFDSPVWSLHGGKVSNSNFPLDFGSGPQVLHPTRLSLTSFSVIVSSRCSTSPSANNCDHILMDEPTDRAKNIVANVS